MTGPVDRLRARLAKLGVDRAWPLLLVAALAVAGLVVSMAGQFVPAPSSYVIEDVALPAGALDGQLAITDTDLDGLPDALENYVYGTDPENWDSSGTGIPDGYYAHFGYHPLQEGVADQPVAVPPIDALPAAYGGVWPDRYRLSISAFYELTRPTGYTAGQDQPWWKGRDTPDPRRWDANDDGVADAWFVVARLDPFDTPLDQVAPGSDDTLTVFENWELGTNPSRADTDGDGLTDAEEPALGTDPTKFSTLDAGVADGWLVALGLDPLDASVLYADPDRDGLTTAEEFKESRALAPERSIQELATTGLDPFRWDSSGDGIPDGWLVAHGLNALDPSVGDQVTERASDFPGVRFLTDAPEGREPLGDLELTVRDEYAAGRPSSWNESRDGVWWGGTSPATNDTDGDGLPDVIEVRGWYIALTTGRGPGAQRSHVLVFSDASRADSDGDGLSDLEEYRGLSNCGGETERAFAPSHPGRSDSAFSGLSDLDKVCGFELDGRRYDFGAPADGGLEPTVADADGDLMPDGAEVLYWHRRAQGVTDPYPFPDSPFASTLDMAARLPSYAGASARRVADALAPDGDWDGDGLANVLDPDSSSALRLEGESICSQHSEDPSVTFLLDGPQIDPVLYRFTGMASANPRPATDPANPDTDGDGLPDAWEARSARFLVQENRWSLDPTKAASGGTVPDGRANLDGDIVEYLAPPATVREYVHDNLQECRSGTDPNVLASDGDGISDGWKVLWGLRYVDLVAASDPIVGDLSDAEREQVLSRAGQVTITPGTPVPNAPPPWRANDFPISYTRFHLLAEGDAVCDQRAALVAAALGELELMDWESIPAGASTQAPCVTTIDDETRLLLPIRGRFNASFQDLYGTGANPYLDDGDRDGVEDWFEVLHARLPGRTGTVPSPLAVDGDFDTDEDGLSMREEFEAWRDAGDAGGPDPMLADSDFDGLSDADEVRAGFDPKDPFTRETLEARGGDADQDGISDLDEIKGWNHGGAGVLFKTSPVSPDTDGDGLLDNKADPGPARPELDRLGIARVTSANSVTYLGEGTYRSDPTKMDSSGEGVPDGWQAYYQEHIGSQGPTTRAPGLVAAYEAARPIWWDESLHGVWWWGLPPDAPPCGDLDGDGLSDTNGEDAFPASANNRYKHGAFETSDAEAAKAYILGAPSKTAARERAQAWAPGAGDPLPAREHLRVACPKPDLDAAILSEVVFTPDPPVLGAPISVTGKLRSAAGSPIEGATVILSTLRPSTARAIGVAFTDGGGTFALEGTFVAEQSTVVPPNSIFLGTSGNEVAWTAKVDDLATGPRTDGVNNRLVLWSYNTTKDGGARHDAVRSFSSVSRMAVELPQATLVGERVQGNATLTDGLGRPLAQRTLTLSWAGTQPPTTRNLVTDAGGRAMIDVPGAVGIGPTALEVAFAGSDQVKASTQRVLVPVRVPADLTLALEPDALTAGEALTLRGHVRSDETLPEGVTIELVAGGETTNATLGTDGSFEASVVVPEATKPGPLAVLATFAGTDRIAPAEARATAQVLGASVLRAPDSLTFERLRGGLLRGEVVDGGGEGIEATVVLVGAGLPSGEVLSGSDGTWFMPFSPGLSRGQYDGQLQVIGSDEHAGAQRPIVITVRGGAEIRIDDLPEVVRPDSTFEVAGALVDDAGRPVIGEGVSVRGPHGSAQALTSNKGRFAMELTVPADALLGRMRLQVGFAGSLDGTLPAASANETLFVKRPSVVTVLTKHTPLARPMVAGVLVNDAGEPVPGQRIAVDLDTGERVGRVETVTGATGHFNASFPGGLAAKATQATVTARFPGTQVVAADHHVAPLNLTTPLAWDVAAPAKLPHLRTTTIAGTVSDAKGPAIRAGTVLALLDGREIGTADVTNGDFVLRLIVPSDVRPGAARLVLQLDPPGLHAATPSEHDVTVTSVPRIEISWDEQLRAGQPYRALATVLDEGGNPMANVTLVYWIETTVGNAVPAAARTNATGHAILSGLAPEVGNAGADAELRVVARGPMLTNEVGIATVGRVAAPAPLSLVPAVLLALFVAALAATWVIARRRRQQVSEVHGIVDDLIGDLEMGNEYQAAVMLAYARIRNHLEAHGYLDKPDFTVREFFAAVQRSLPLPADEVKDFVDLFEQARYSPHGVGPEHRTSALMRLRRIRDAIEGGIRGATP